MTGGIAYPATSGSVGASTPPSNSLGKNTPSNTGPGARDLHNTVIGPSGDTSLHACPPVPGSLGGTSVSAPNSSVVGTSFDNVAVGLTATAPTPPTGYLTNTPTNTPGVTAYLTCSIPAEPPKNLGHEGGGKEHKFPKNRRTRTKNQKSPKFPWYRYPEQTPHFRVDRKVRKGELEVQHVDTLSSLGRYEKHLPQEKPDKTKNPKTKNRRTTETNPPTVHAGTVTTAGPLGTGSVHGAITVGNVLTGVPKKNDSVPGNPPAPIVSFGI